MRQVLYVLLTRSPLSFSGASTKKTSLDLHVLGTPPAFVLSQDQTLQDILKLFDSSFIFVVANYLARIFLVGFNYVKPALWLMFTSFEVITFYCSVFKDQLCLHNTALRRLDYNNRFTISCQQLFLIFLIFLVTNLQEN